METNAVRSVSPKRQRRNREADPVRRQFADDNQYCMVCGRLGGDIHEIARGPARQKALDQVYALLRLCRADHDRVHKHWSMAQQYALKGLRDPDNYSRTKLNRLRGRAPDAISERQVWQALPEVLKRVRLRIA